MATFPVGEDPENLRWLHWQSTLLMGGPIYVPAGPELDRWRISSRGFPGRAAYGITARVEPAGLRRLWATTHVRETLVHPVHLLRHLLSLVNVPDPVTLPYQVTVLAGEAALPIGRAGHVDLQLLTCVDAWIGHGRVRDRWLEVGARGVEPDAVRLEEILDVSAVAEEHGGLGGVAPPAPIIPLQLPDREDHHRRLWEGVPQVGGPFYVPSGPGLASCRVGRTGSGSSSSIAAIVNNADTTSLGVSTHLDGSEIAEHSMVRQLLAVGIRPPESFPYTAQVSAREAALPLGTSGSVTLRVLESDRMWIGYGPVGDRWVVVTSLGVSLDGLRLDEVADTSSIPFDQRG